MEVPHLLTVNFWLAFLIQRFISGLAVLFYSPSVFVVLLPVLCLPKTSSFVQDDCWNCPPEDGFFNMLSSQHSPENVTSVFPEDIPGPSAVDDKKRCSFVKNRSSYL